MNFSADSIACFIAKSFGFVVRRLPVRAALAVGRTIGAIGYYLDTKHKAIAYSNLKNAFARKKKPSEIKQIVKEQFKNYGQNLIELLRLPFLGRVNLEEFVKVEGKEHVYEALKQKKGVILIAMHFGSWEVAGLIGKILNLPYNVLAKPQDKFSRLDGLLNSYRESTGSSVILRGRGTREVIESLRRNEIVGMVVDQGGKDGVLVKFFGRLASMSVGALRLALKFETPICFAVIIREKGSSHKVIIHPPLDLIKSDNVDQDIVANLNVVTKLMEDYITRYPAEYMWFYKIWKYSKEATVVVLSDGKAGHLRQSQATSRMLEGALRDRGIEPTTEIVDVEFKNKFSAKALSVFSFLTHPRFCQGRLRYLKWFLTHQSYLKIASVKADYVISCGSSIAGVNFLLSADYQAKSVCVLRPGILGFERFNLIILPQHDGLNNHKTKGRKVDILGAANLITSSYLKEQSALLKERFPYLKQTGKLKVGLLLGGDNKNYSFGADDAKTLIGELKIACQKIDADLFVTTSRRTSRAVEVIVQNEMGRCAQCRLLILANQANIPEAVGGILGVSDIVIVSAESIAMVSEAASSGKNVIVFAPKEKSRLLSSRNKHKSFIEAMDREGYIVLSEAENIGKALSAFATGEKRTRVLNNNQAILDAVRFVI